MYYIFLSWKHRYKQTFAIACLFIVNKLHATDSNISGFWQNTDPRSTDPLLTPCWPPYWPPIKSMGKWKLKKPRTINGTDSSSPINLAHLKLPRWRLHCRFPTLLFSFGSSVEVLLTENRAQIKLEYHQILFLYTLENEAKRNTDKWAGSRKGLWWTAHANDTNTCANLNRKNFLDSFVCTSRLPNWISGWCNHVCVARS